MLLRAFCQLTEYCNLWLAYVLKHTHLSLVHDIKFKSLLRQELDMKWLQR